MIIEESELMHYGVIRRSGRYPWGSGGNEDQHNKILLDYISEMKSAGMTEAKIAEALGMTTTALRAEKSIARNQQRASNVALAQRLKDKGMGYTAIGERMNMPESTIRGLLAPSTKEKEDILLTTSEMLKAEVDKHEIIDVGRGVELGIPIGASHVGVSETRLKTATHMLWMQGYETHTFKVPQQTNPGKNTTVKVICKPGMTQKKLGSVVSMAKHISSLHILKMAVVLSLPSFVSPLPSIPSDWKLITQKMVAVRPMA